MSGFNLDAISGAFSQQMTSAEATLTRLGEAMNANPNDVRALIESQRALNVWSNIINLQSTIVKTFGETLRGIVQKMP